MQRPRLRDNKNEKPFELYSIGQFPTKLIVDISRWIIYFYAIGTKDLTGEDWGDIFAKSIDGEHFGKPLGLADVSYEGMAWSAKTVKCQTPFTSRSVRVISGRCSPDYSFGISNPHENIQKTGEAVLSIWNERINIAKNRFEPLRTCVLIRNFSQLEFSLFELETARYILDEYVWKINKRGNFEGFSLTDGTHKFTWQPHGSQFTIIYQVPRHAIKFKIRRPPVMDIEYTMAQIGFNDDWVTLFQQPN